MCRPHRRTGPPNIPWSTRRHSIQRRDTGADGSEQLRGRHRATTVLDLSTTRTPCQRHRRAA
eukprot:4705297-Prymnesium_polylepis.1